MLHVHGGAITFIAVVRKQQVSPLHSLCVCNNAVLHDFVRSDRFCVLLYLQNGIKFFV